MLQEIFDIVSIENRNILQLLKQLQDDVSRQERRAKKKKKLCILYAFAPISRHRFIDSFE